MPAEPAHADDCEPHWHWPARCRLDDIDRHLERRSHRRARDIAERHSGLIDLSDMDELSDSCAKQLTPPKRAHRSDCSLGIIMTREGGIRLDEEHLK